MFTFVPPNKTISACLNPNIGQALAQDNCGPVSITNDAPSKFPLGTTTVRWFASDTSGNVKIAQQSVTAILGDDPSCCPNNTHLILGSNTVSDVIFGTPGADCILGRGGNDTINSADGNDYVSGGAGNDTITTGNGNDYLKGGAGVDTCFAPPGQDTVLNCEI